MTETTNPHAVPGSSFHWLRSGVLYRSKATDPAVISFTSKSEVSRRGQTVVITADLLGACPWLDLLGDEQGQVERWGEIRIAPGDWPSDLPTWTPGTREQEEAYDAARREAWGRPVGPERDAALTELRRVWGNGPATSRTLSHITGDEQRTKPQPRERVRY
jgi:hypothetical protein